jgi:hypothetical protein
MRGLSAVGILAILSLAGPAFAAGERDHEALVSAIHAGEMLPMRSVEQQVLPKMRGYKYLGPEVDMTSRTHRLKFMRHGRIIWLDVDARTGRVIGHWAG